VLHKAQASTRWAQTGPKIGPISNPKLGPNWTQTGHARPPERNLRRIWTRGRESHAARRAAHRPSLGPRRRRSAETGTTAAGPPPPWQVQHVARPAAARRPRSGLDGSALPTPGQGRSRRRSHRHTRLAQHLRLSSTSSSSSRRSRRHPSRTKTTTTQQPTLPRPSARWAPPPPLVSVAREMAIMGTVFLGLRDLWSLSCGSKPGGISSFCVRVFHLSILRSAKLCLLYVYISIIRKNGPPR
jgi:hypothetical protein